MIPRSIRLVYLIILTIPLLLMSSCDFGNPLSGGDGYSDGIVGRWSSGQREVWISDHNKGDYRITFIEPDTVRKTSYSFQNDTIWINVGYTNDIPWRKIDKLEERTMDWHYTENSIRYDTHWIELPIGN